MVKLIALFLLFSAFYAAPAAAQIYRCNVDGKMVFTDQPCEGGRVTLQDSNVIPAIDTSDVQLAERKTYASSKWYIDYDGYQTALMVSRRNDVPMLLYFQADWCGYCRKLESELFETRKGKAALSKVVKVRITPENGADERAFFEKLGGKGYPSIFIKSSFKSNPVKRYLMKKVNNRWVTKSASYLEKITAY